MAEMTLAEIDAEIAELEASHKQWLKGDAVSEVGYDGVRTRFAGDSSDRIGMIRERLAELRAMRARLTGESSGRGPIGVGFGRW